jgi:UDP-glucose 4-epimerase
MGNKFLVTGGAGFIGSHIVDNLVEKGGEVIVIDDLRTGKKENINLCAKFYETDICNMGELRRIFEFEKPEIVLHLAANPMLRKSLEDPAYDARVNILGSINVLECCRLNGVKKIIYTSTGGARVGEPEYLPVDEKHPIKPCSPYGISKHSVEHYVEMYGELYGLDYLIFCFGNVYGPRDDIRTGRLIPIFIDKMLKGECPRIFGDGGQTRDFIYVEDLAKFIVESLEKECCNKLFHLANGKQISINYVCELLKKYTGFSGEICYVEGVKGEVRDIVLDIRKVKEELGWSSQTSIEEGLKKSVEWFKE